MKTQPTEPTFSGSLPHDVARCNGVGFQEDDGWDWREGCETCLRRTAPCGDQVWMIEPPPIIAFECEFLIPPNAEASERLVRQPSVERGCNGKASLGRSYAKQADSLSKKHGKRYGVYACPHCGGSHLTTKLEKSDKYSEFLYISLPNV